MSYLTRQLFFLVTNPKCCVFRPVNGCSTRRVLVEIMFLMLKQLFPSLKQLFPSFSVHKCLKNTDVTLNSWLTPQSWSTPGENMCYFCIFFSFFVLFLLVMDKDKKTYFNAESNDFDQQTACGALVCWSKYMSTKAVSIKMIHFEDN